MPEEQTIIEKKKKKNKARKMPHKTSAKKARLVSTIIFENYPFWVESLTPKQGEWGRERRKETKQSGGEGGLSDRR